MLRGLLFVGSILYSFSSFAQQDEIRKSIYFDGGSWYIDDFQVEDLTHWIDSIPNLLDKYQIQLISHTDPIGGKEYNEWLSQMRSGAVFKLLIDLNIPEKIISIKDWGLDNPVYENDDWRGRIMNRRVDVIIHPIVF
jgi:outer membrane protein OmpA-like peptidoglycan-associated protein